MSEPIDLAQRSEALADQLRVDFPTFHEHDVRIDAGDPGMIYVAVRGAKREPDVGRRLADEMTSVIEEVLAQVHAEIEYAVSLGTGNEDLLLQIELREV